MGVEELPEERKPQNQLKPAISKEAYQAKLMVEFKTKYLTQHGLYLYICQCCKNETYLHKEYCDCGFKNEYVDKSTTISDAITEKATEDLFAIKFSDPPEVNQQAVDSRLDSLQIESQYEMVQTRAQIGLSP